MKYRFLLIFLILPLTVFSLFKEPDEFIVKIADTPPFPVLQFVQFEEFAFEMTYKNMMDIEFLAQEEDKTAGLIISKKYNAKKNNHPYISLKINFFNDRTYNVKFPVGSVIRGTSISPDNSKLAIIFDTPRGVELYVVSIDNGRMKRIRNLLINDLFGSGIQWLCDSRTILVSRLPKKRKYPEKKELRSPLIEETGSEVSRSVTYQNLIREEYDERLFEYYGESQLSLVNVNSGKFRDIGSPGVFEVVDVSPDSKFIFITRIIGPYSYNHPYYFFAKELELWTINGIKKRTLHKRPVQDSIPRGGVAKGIRWVMWKPSENASLIWVEALDEGDPRNQVDFRDRVMKYDIYSEDDPKEILRTKYRFAGIEWSEHPKEFIYHQYDRDRLWNTATLVRSGEEKVIFDMSTRNRYDAPGNLVMKRIKSNKTVYVEDGSAVYYINNQGATPEGNLPFLARFDLDTLEFNILHRCDQGYFETISSFYGKGFDKVVTRRENTENPRNYHTVDLTNGERKRFTDYQNPYPEELKNLKKELITYKRDDGVTLSGTLYLPHDHKGEKLPLIISAYPREFADPETADQVSASPNRFTIFWGSTEVYMALKGYAVLSNASIPIVGDPETVNNTFLEQTIASVKAAIDHLSERGIIDEKKVGVIGHSYGAFMVANVLAHSDLGTAGIARSGAYNRTMTPFGFQSERRDLWDAKDFYIKVSPFMNAEKIKTPLLLIHGEQDPNPGTYPMQSERFYQAIKGTGGIARLVILPYEGHHYVSRQSNLHVLYEMIEWFGKYLKDGNGN